MDSLQKKISYLKGFSEALELEKDSKEGKVLSLIIDVLDELVDEVNDISEDLDDLDDFVMDLEEELMDLGEDIDFILDADDDDEDYDSDEYFDDVEHYCDEIYRIPEEGDEDYLSGYPDEKVDEEELCSAGCCAVEKEEDPGLFDSEYFNISDLEKGARKEG